MNRGRLIAHTAHEIGLDDTVGSDERLFMEEWAQEGVHDVLLKTRIRVELGDLTLQVGISDYRLDTEVMAVIDVNPVGGGDATVIELDELYDKRRLQDSPDKVMYFAAEGDLLLVYPTPGAAQVIRYVFVAVPTPMTDDAHDPSNPTYGGIPVQYHFAIRDYMLSMASRYDGTKAPLSPRDYATSYQDSISQIKKARKQMSGRQPMMPRVGYPNRPSIGRRNDVYP